MNPCDAQPLVTVGVPVLNGGELLERALNAIVRQTYAHIEIVVSDNDSTDRTAEVIRAFAARDSRFKCHRQSVRLSAFANFRFVLDQSRGRYFMWAPHDDWWNERYIENGITCLENSTQASAVMGAIRYYNEREEEVLRYDPPYGLSGVGCFRRVYHYLTHPVTDHLFYALFRSSALRGTIWSESTSPEKVVIMHALLRGPVLDGAGMEYHNRYIPKTREEIAAVHALQGYRYRYQFRAMVDVMREIWRGARRVDALRLIPIYFFTQSWHKLLLKWAVSLLRRE